jgi:hypothetical protein
MFLVATEDELSEAVARKLVEGAKIASEGVKCVRRNGFGYLKGNLKKFSEAARIFPVLMLTDLDQKPCVPGMIADWFAGLEKPAGLLFRVAVRETEAWLLADRVAVAEFFGVAAKRIERDSEGIDRPKEYLLNLARSAPRRLRDDLLPKRGAAATQGLGYNARLCEFVETIWSPRRAAESCRSLQKTIRRIDALATAGH